MLYCFRANTGATAESRENTMLSTDLQSNHNKTLFERTRHLDSHLTFSSKFAAGRKLQASTNFADDQKHGLHCEEPNGKAVPEQLLEHWECVYPAAKVPQAPTLSASYKTTRLVNNRQCRTLQKMSSDGYFRYPMKRRLPASPCGEDANRSLRKWYFDCREHGPRRLADYSRRARSLGREPLELGLMFRTRSNTTSGRRRSQPHLDGADLTLTNEQLYERPAMTSGVQERFKLDCVGGQLGAGDRGSASYAQPIRQVAIDCDEPERRWSANFRFAMLLDEKRYSSPHSNANEIPSERREF